MTVIHVVSSRLRAEASGLSLNNDRYASPEQEKTPFSVERARPADAPALYDVMRTTWLHTYPNDGLAISVEDIRARIEGRNGEDIATRVERWRETIANPDRDVFVAREGEHVVGYVAPFFDETEQHYRVGGLYVLPAAQGKGLGHRLLEASIASIGRELDIYLHVVTYNVRTIAFYKRHGFVETGRDMTGSTAGLGDGRHIPEMEMVLPAASAPDGGIV
jgi:ribosomal protein S18 acetylase RimI-like enzyme